MVCRTFDHFVGGMKHLYEVSSCRNTTRGQQQHGDMRLYYIAAEEVEWDYASNKSSAPNMYNISSYEERYPEEKVKQNAYGYGMHLQWRRTFEASFHEASLLLFRMLFLLSKRKCFYAATSSQTRSVHRQCCRSNFLLHSLSALNCSTSPFSSANVLLSNCLVMLLDPRKLPSSKIHVGVQPRLNATMMPSSPLLCLPHSLQPPHLSAFLTEKKSDTCARREALQATQMH